MAVAPASRGPWETISLTLAPAPRSPSSANPTNPGPILQPNSWVPGYRLGDGERPTFLYSYKDVRIEDFPNAVEGKGQPAIRRAFTLSTENPAEKLYFRAAVADKIEAAGDGWYRINDWRICRIEADAPPEIRRAGGKMELLVPVRFQGKTAKIVQEFVW